jgi:hypothetical protein
MNKTNRFLIIALFVQVAILIMGMSLAKEDGTRTQKSMKVFEGLDPAKVTKIKILGEPKDAGDSAAPGQQSVELVKDGTSWVLPGADNYPVDPTKVNELLEKLQKLKSRGPVLTKKTYHKKLEVAEDKFQRLVTLTMDGKDVKFYVGSSPSFKNVHFRRDGSDEVLQVGDLTQWEIGARPADWVERAYVKIPEKDVWGLTIQNKTGMIKLAKSAFGEWTAQGINGPLKKTVIDDLVRKAGTINVEEPVGKSEKPEQGLAEPLATVSIETGTSSITGKMPDEIKTDVVRIGSKIDKDNRYYAKSTTSGYVVQVASWGVEPFVTKTAKDLIDEPTAPKKDEPAPAKGTSKAPAKAPAKAPPKKK